MIRTGSGSDSDLMRRSLGRFSGQIVASPDYLGRRGLPRVPADLEGHDCLRQRRAATGKLVDWPLTEGADGARTVIPETMSANTIDPLVQLAERGFGLAFLPPFAVAPQIEAGILIPLLEGSCPTDRGNGRTMADQSTALTENTGLRGLPCGSLEPLGVVKVRFRKRVGHRGSTGLGREAGAPSSPT